MHQDDKKSEQQILKISTNPSAAVQVFTLNKVTRCFFFYLSINKRQTLMHINSNIGSFIKKTVPLMTMDHPSIFCDI